MTSRIYHHSRFFFFFTEIVFVVNICWVILSETVLLVAEHHLISVCLLIFTSLGVKYCSFNTFFVFYDGLFTEVVPYFPLLRFVFYCPKSRIVILLLVHIISMVHINTLSVIFVCYTHINRRVVVTL